MFADSEAARSICAKTGLAQLPTREQEIYRVAKVSYGSMNPPKRAVDGDASGWGRFDVPGQQVLYGAHPLEAAYAESLASLRVAIDIRETFVDEIFNDDPASSATLVEEVSKEWETGCQWRPGTNPASWRHGRARYALRLPPEGWVVDVCHSRSIAAINSALKSELPRLGVTDSLGQADLLGENRALTSFISSWVWHQTFSDGRLPHGILYPSKHGTDFTCFAIYLRALGDGKPVTKEPTTSDSGSEIQDRYHDPVLNEVLTLLDLDGY